MTQPKTSAKGSPRATGGGKKKVAVGGAGAVVLAIVVLAVQHFTGVDLTGQGAKAGDGDQPVARQTSRASGNPQSPASATKAPASPPKATKQANPPVQDPTDDAVAAQGVQAMKEAFANGQSDLIVEAAGRIIKVLPDDHEGDRHQRFILKTATGQTVLVAHNIDLAPRVPVREGDFVRFKGEYEWSEQGGVIHWTHHDPKGWRDDGWIEHDGKLYQ